MRRQTNTSTVGGICRWRRGSGFRFSGLTTYPRDPPSETSSGPCALLLLPALCIAGNSGRRHRSLAACRGKGRTGANSKPKSVQTRQIRSASAIGVQNQPLHQAGQRRHGAPRGLDTFGLLPRSPRALHGISARISCSTSFLHPPFWRAPSARRLCFDFERVFRWNRSMREAPAGSIDCAGTLPSQSEELAGCCQNRFPAAPVRLRRRTAVAHPVEGQ